MRNREQVSKPFRTLRREKSWEAYAMKRTAAGAHLPTPWLFEPAKRPYNKSRLLFVCREPCLKFICRFESDLGDYSVQLIVERAIVVFYPR